MNPVFGPCHEILRKTYFLVKPFKKVWIGDGESLSAFFVKCVLFVNIGCWPQYSRLGPALPKIGKHFTASALEPKPLPEMLFQLFVFFKLYICLFAIAYFSEQPEEKTGVTVLLIEEIYGGILWDIL